MMSKFPVPAACIKAVVPVLHLPSRSAPCQRVNNYQQVSDVSDAVYTRGYKDIIT